VEHTVNGKRILFALILLTAVVLLNLPLPLSMRVKEPTRDQIAPFQNIMSLVLRKAGGFVDYCRESDELAEQKQELRARIVELQEEVRQLRHMGKENARLNRLLEFRRSAGRRLIPAAVVARDDVSGWWHSVRLNVGRYEGVAVDMAVITTEGLAGRIVEVSAHTSDVLLLTDRTSRVACRFTGSGAFGVVEGRGVSLLGNPRMEMLCAPLPLGMKYVDKNVTVREGDEVVTSGLGGVFPEGLLLGRVKGVSPNVSGLFQCAEIVPAANLSELRYAFVVVQ